MKSLTATIAASSDSFGAFDGNSIGIFAAGDSVAAVKEDFAEAIRIYKEITPEEDWAEAIRDNWPIEWHYDVQSLLVYYKNVFSNAALARMTGINQKQLWNYANGVSKPRKAAEEKIIKALNTLGQELIQITI